MGAKFYSTDTIVLGSGDNTVIAAPAADAADYSSTTVLETFLRLIEIERVNLATDVTLIFKNNAAPTPRELRKRWTLNADKGAIVFVFDDETEIGVGGGLAFVVNASVGSAANIRCEYRVGPQINWPS